MSRNPTLNLKEFLESVGDCRFHLFQDATNFNGQAISEMVENACAQPRGYPPLRDALLESDHVSLVISSPLAQVNQTAESLANWIRATCRSHVSLVVSKRAFERYWKDRSGDQSLVVHEPGDSQDVALIGIDQHDRPIYVNRLLFDADQVIPVSSSATGDSARDSEGVVPEFLGLESRVQFEQLNLAEQRQIARLVLENLGIFSDCQVILGPGGHVQQILFGELNEVRGQAAKETERAWKMVLPSRFPIVVGTLESHDDSDAWNELTRAFVAVQEAALPGAPLVLITELETPPPRRVVEALSEREWPHARKQPEVARKIGDLLAAHPLYLVSSLSREVVESLGIGYVQNLDELNRLWERFGQPLLVRDAQAVRVEFETDSK